VLESSVAAVGSLPVCSGLAWSGVACSGVACSDGACSVAACYQSADSVADVVGVFCAAVLPARFGAFAELEFVPAPLCLGHQ